MADIHPFRAFRYDSQKITLSQVVTQPYDKITPRLQDQYYAANPHNLVRIILGRREEHDNPANNVYSRAAAHFRDWRQQGILRQDSLPSSTSIPSASLSPTRPPNWNAVASSPSAASKTILPASSSATNKPWPSPKPTASTCSAPRAPISARFSCSMRTQGQVEPFLTTTADPDISVPDLQVEDEYGVLHCVWQVSDPALINSVQTAMHEKKLIIADGHHRYETALTTATNAAPPIPRRRSTLRPHRLTSSS